MAYDFFISYNKHDREIAEWIGWELEEEGYSIIIQAWDFKGNWIKEMDDAVRTSNKTIAVLSPHYVNADYTFSEWAEAFKGDGRGNNDKLITVRVADFEPKGIIGQLVYVDLVNKTEAEAKELLLQRVKGLRGKPTKKPPFSISGTIEETVHREVIKKPVFPAAREDEENFKKIRNVVIEWRKQHSLQVKQLEITLDKLEEWMKQPPGVLSKEISDAIITAHQLAIDFKAIELEDLKKATPYGLQIHETVFWGQALHTASHLHSVYNRPGIVELYTESDGKNDSFLSSLLPSKYDYEMLGRVVRSALALTRYDISNLPKGFIAPAIQGEEMDLKQYNQLSIASLDYDPSLYLISINENVQRLQAFAARQLTLYPIQARVNLEGSLDLIAHDFEHVYLWQKSSTHPVFQFTFTDSIVAAYIAETKDRPWITVISAAGRLYSLTTSGTKTETSSAFAGHSITNAVFWNDTYDEQKWHVIVSSDTWIITSALQGKMVSGELNKDGDFWDHPIFLTEDQLKTGATVFWETGCKLKLTTYDGLPCLLLTRSANDGTRVCFLDPVSLGFLRSPVIIEEFMEEVTLACGRWLIAGLFQTGSVIKPRIIVWDLNEQGFELCGNWLFEDGDIYFPQIIEENKSSFKVLMVLRLFLTSESKNYKLISFDWPSGEVTYIQEYKELRLRPVTLQE